MEASSNQFLSHLLVCAQLARQAFQLHILLLLHALNLVHFYPRNSPRQR
jgi:hypothetical protein